MAQIEHAEGVQNIDSILNVRGIDAIFIGPYDLSASMGLPGQVQHPEVIMAIRNVKNKCADAAMPYGIFASGPEPLRQEIDDGCRYILCGVDSSLMSSSLRDLSDRLHKMIQ